MPLDVAPAWVTAAWLSQSRDEFLAAGQHGLRTRPANERDLEIARLRAEGGRAHDGQRAVE